MIKKGNESIFPNPPEVNINIRIINVFIVLAAWSSDTRTEQKNPYALIIKFKLIVVAMNNNRFYTD